MIDLEAIKARWKVSAARRQGAEGSLAAMRSASDVPALVAEVERLRAELARLKSTPVAGFCVCAPIPKLRVGQFLVACETCGRMRYVDSTPTTSSKRFRVDL